MFLLHVLFFYIVYINLFSLNASVEQVHVFLAGTSSCPACVATSSLLQLHCSHLQSKLHAKHLLETQRGGKVRRCQIWAVG
jgi:hypothetical protein